MLIEIFPIAITNFKAAKTYKFIKHDKVKKTPVQAYSTVSKFCGKKTPYSPDPLFRVGEILSEII
ncbi:MAG: hypothetical protein H8E10_19585 [Desulfobacterales bacterium]|nr:hypothetical protein [Desulfobacterales bacterium]MBL7173415.1 hypothetical protein [Desulfobacteraceae bacterium]